MPGTEIYTTWGYLGAKTPIYGSGFGLSVGYLFATWKNFKLYGDIGFNSISVESEKNFSDIVPNGPKEKAKWNLGGIQLQIRGSFGFWNKPEPKDDDDDDDDDGDKKPKVTIIDDTKNSAKTAVQDSAKIRHKRCAGFYWNCAGKCSYERTGETAEKYARTSRRA